MTLMHIEPRRKSLSALVSQDPAVMVAWARRRGLASLSVYEVSLLLRRLKFDAFVEHFVQQQV